jgi:hypothetical protein
LFDDPQTRCPYWNPQDFWLLVDCPGFKIAKASRCKAIAISIKELTQTPKAIDSDIVRAISSGIEKLEIVGY